MINKTINKYKDGRGAKIIRIASGNALGQLVNLLSVPVIARLYSPEQMGKFSIAFSIAFIASRVGGMNFEKALLTAEIEEVPYLIVLFYYSLIGLLALCVLSVGIIHYTDCFSLNGSDMTVVILSVVLFGILSVLELARSYSVKKDYPGRAGISRFCEVLTGQLVKIVLAVISLASAGSLLIGHLVGGVVGIIVVFFKQVFFVERRCCELTALQTIAHKYRQFPIYSTVNILLNLVSRYSVHGVLALYYGFSVVGVYALTERVIMQPMLTFADAVRSVTLSSAQLGPAELKKQLVKTTLSLFILGVFFVVFITLFSKQITLIVFGNGWPGADKFLVLLSFGVLFLFSNSMALFMFELCGQQQLKTKILLFQFVTRIAVLFIGCSMKLSVYNVLLGFVCVNIVLEICKFMMSYKLVENRRGYAS